MYSDFKDTLKKTDFNSTFLAMYIDKLDRQNSSIFTFDQDQLHTVTAYKKRAKQLLYIYV